MAAISELRQQLAEISSPSGALAVRTKAERAKEIFKFMGRSVEDCNELAEIYLSAHWKFGELVDVPVNQEGLTDQPLPGSKNQRNFARKFKKKVRESDIPEYVREATDLLEQASIAGCLKWLDGGRHGNLLGEYEWYTPAPIIEAARAVMGGIDLDPSSCAIANEVVKAERYFTEEENGLEQHWEGSVFINPPFAHPTVKYFAEKLLDSFGDGGVEQAVWLSNACVDVGWWQRLAQLGTVCFHAGRIRFYGAEGKLQPPTLGQSIIYLGDNHDAFRATFLQFGVVLA